MDRIRAVSAQQQLTYYHRYAAISANRHAIDIAIADRTCYRIYR